MFYIGKVQLSSIKVFNLFNQLPRFELIINIEFVFIIISNWYKLSPVEYSDSDLVWADGMDNNNKL